ncbi:MAG: hypothetical protein JWL77_3721 [Chthonomonadaceae bacterium]|nr:hypothetical protein [Chthonomonadaceae bacterium]
MKAKTGIPFGVCVLPAPVRNAGRVAQYADYIEEILQHAGVCYDRIDPEDLPVRLPTLRLLLTVGEATLAEEQRQSLAQWVAEGGAWLSLAGLCGLEATLGVVPEKPAYVGFGAGLCSLGEGYLQPIGFHPVLDSLPAPLHFFGGIAVTTDTATTIAVGFDSHQRTTSRAVLTENRSGEGCAMLLAIDLTGTIVRIQQGGAVTRDGVSAPDGTAPVTDGVLKSDDGAVLDWIFDRQEVPGIAGFRAFLRPIADAWRDLLMRALLYLAQRQQLALPVLWFYPRDLPAVVHLSHDTDGNAVPEGTRLLEVLKEIDARSTWCVIPPGYPPEMIEAIRNAGHELAMHYDAMSDGLTWSREQFTRQFHALQTLFRGQRPLSNKNHYLRWEGDTELFTWCEEHGIQLDQTKGASKTGEAGFNFGTCHPFFPVAPDGTIHDVLELCTPTQDLEVFAPTALLEPLLQAVLRHYGVMHLLFHPAHIFKPGVAEAMRLAAERARHHGLEFWTAERLNAWERARRACAWTGCDSALTLTLHPSVSLCDATILMLSVSPLTAMVNGEEAPVRTLERWGFPFQAVTVDLQGGSACTLRFLEATRKEKIS